MLETTVVELEESAITVLVQVAAVELKMSITLEVDDPLEQIR